MNQANLSLNQIKTLALFDDNNHICTNDVVHRLNIPRPTAKQILIRLKEIGLIESKGLGRAAFYTIKQESEILDSKGKQLVTVYRGNEAFQKMFNQLSKQLKRNDFYWSFAFKNEYYNSDVSNLLMQFHKDIAKKGVDDRTIGNKEVEQLMKENFKNVPSLKLHFTELNMPVGTIILKDCIINLVWGDHPIAIIIKVPAIYERYYDFFLTSWNQLQEVKEKNIIEKPGNTPLLSLHGCFDVKTLWMKNEVQNPTHTFKDRLAYEMVRPVVEEFLSGKVPKPVTFGSISYGNTAKAMGYFVGLTNKLIGKEIVKAVAFVPPSLEEKTFGPNTSGKKISALRIINDLRNDCKIVPIDLKKKVYRSYDLKLLAKQHGVLKGDFIDITEGLNRPAYVNIIIEAIEQQLKHSPDYVIVPFGAGILCNEIIDYINDHHLHTKVIPVSSGNPDTIAVMLYGPIWVDTQSLLKNGWGWTRHEKTDRKGRIRQPYKVFHVSDDEITEAMKILHAKNLNAEASGASGFALLPRLRKIDSYFDPQKHSVLVINTGDGLLNYN